MIEKLVHQTKESINFFLDQLDLKAFEVLCDQLLSCTGTIFLTGMGKSGIIAKKIAATMISTDTKALYLSPTNAMHGDLGIIGEKDCLLIFSKSGESDELLELLPFLRNKGAICIPVVSNPNSRLAKACDAPFFLPLKEELCPFGLAPTTSAEIQLIFGDILAIALMEKKRF